MHVTIVGGGFGGIKAALDLASEPDIHITLISDRPDFQYYPALYSSATGHSHLASWVPLGEIFADYDCIEVYIDKIDDMDAAKRTLTSELGVVYHYQTCIFAMGVVTSYFGIEGLENYSYGIKSEQEIRKLKQRLFIDIAENHKLDKNYIVVGAGPSGVELSAALGTYIQRLAKRYKIRKHNISVRLIEAAPRILPRSSVRTSRVVTRRLKKLGVKIETGKTVQSETADSLVVSGAPLDSHTVIWTSGVVNNPFFAAHPDVFELSKRGRVVVDDYLKAHENIYVIGDNAETPYCGLAQTALHDAQMVARNLVDKFNHKKPHKYKVIRPVSVIPVGNNWAAMEWGKFHTYGRAGALIRRVADFIGYTDVVPLGTSLGAWRAAKVFEDDYFTPTTNVRMRR